MSAILVGITTSSITWEKESSDIKEDSKGKSTITVLGFVDADDSNTSLEDAILLIPDEIPLGVNGPIGNSQRYAGAKRVERASRYAGDGTIEVTASYEIATPENQIVYGDTGSDTSDSDRIARSSATEDAPILTHPVVQLFPKTQARLLACVLNGDIRVNPRYNEEGTDRQLWEFIRDTENGEDIEQVEFSEETYTVAGSGVEASPLDYARAIAAGVDVWKRPVIRHSVVSARNAPASDSEFTKVGRAVPTASNPIGAPNVAGSRQWFVNSLSDSTENGEAWTINYEYELSGEGGVLKILYPNGAAVLQ